MEKIVVIGGGVGAKGFFGASFALNENLEYTLIRSNAKGPVPCGIPYALGTLEDPNQNISTDKNLLDNDVNMVIDDAVRIDPKERFVETRTGQIFPYDKLVLATGSHPVFPPFPGKELKGIHVIEKDLDKVAALKPEVEAARSVLIVGGGFIGVELADEIAKMGNKKITLVELANHCLNVAFESHISEEIEETLKSHKIDVLTGAGVESFEGQEQVERVKLNDGRLLEADLVFVAIGASPNADLARQIGLELDERKAVKVNEFQQTSDENIFAIGDCASKIDIFTGKASNIRLASIAAKEGRNAAMNLTGRKKPLSVQGIMNLFSTSVGNYYYAAAGMTKAQCIGEGFDVLEVKVDAANQHPATLPGTVKIRSLFFFDKKDLKLLGAQIIGDKAVAEMVNALGIALQNQVTAMDLFSYNYGTHPLGTASPNHYVFHQAGLKAIATQVRS